jgi:hypothetical protein
MDASIGATGEHQGLFVGFRVGTSDVHEIENGSTRYEDVTGAVPRGPSSGGVITDPSSLYTLVQAVARNVRKRKMHILEWTDVFSSVCDRGRDALLWGPAEPWVHIELFAELRRRAPLTGWAPFPMELPCVTFYPVRLPKQTNRNWQVDGAVKWVDLCLRSETGNKWCWFELKVRGAGGPGREKKAALEARDVFRKDVVALMGFDAYLTAETWVNPDIYTTAYWTESVLKPKAPSLSSGEHHFVASYLHLGGELDSTVWDEPTLTEQIRKWLIWRSQSTDRESVLPELKITAGALPTDRDCSLVTCEWFQQV